MSSNGLRSADDSLILFICFIEKRQTFVQCELLTARCKDIVTKINFRFFKFKLSFKNIKGHFLKVDDVFVYRHYCFQRMIRN